MARIAEAFWVASLIGGGAGLLARAQETTDDMFRVVFGVAFLVLGISHITRNWRDEG